DLKYIIGYSSVSHMGYVLMGIATMDRIGMGGAVLQMFSHGIMTALMFLLVGSIYDRAHIRDINVLNGLSSRMRVTSFFFAIAGLASMGLPGLSGFIAEFMVFTGTFRTYLPLAVLAVVARAQGREPRPAARATAAAKARALRRPVMAARPPATAAPRRDIAASAIRPTPTVTPTVMA
ncbi:MAG: hypothetical protein IIC53_12045, partial [Proteobacteria bacterium]|nr:hypothetical protein [Pseudomonadota bacterium]